MRPLLIFVVIVCLNVSGLLFDLALWLSGRSTMSEYVWKDPVLGVPIVALQAIAVLALAMHFWG